MALPPTSNESHGRLPYGSATYAPQHRPTTPRHLDHSNHTSLHASLQQCLDGQRGVPIVSLQRPDNHLSPQIRKHGRQTAVSPPKILHHPLLTHVPISSSVGALAPLPPVISETKLPTAARAPRPALAVVLAALPLAVSGAAPDRGMLRIAPGASTCAWGVASVGPPGVPPTRLPNRFLKPTWGEAPAPTRALDAAEI